MQAPVIWRLFTSALSALAAALVVAAMTLAADAAIHRLHSWLVAIHVHLPGLQQNYINAAAGAILQLSVVIIGLYAAAFSVVMSTVYGRVYGDVRELLLKDVASNAFLRSIAFMASYTAFLLLAQSFGVAVGYVSVIALTIALVSSVQTFVTAGIGIFRLFDPHKLLPQLQGDLADAISSSTSRGYRSDTPSFQNAYRERAERDLLALEHLLEASDRAKQVADLASFALTLFRYYETLKRAIPSGSLWFRKKYQFVDWLTADAESLALALNTRTAIQPREVPEDDWFESEIIRILLRAFRQLRSLNDPTVLHRFSAKFGKAIADVSYVLAVPEAAAFARAMIPAMLEFLDIGADDEVSNAVRLEIADAAAMACTSIAVGLLNRIRNLDGDKIRGLAARVRSGRRIPRNSWLPKDAYDALARMGESWRLERRVEGRTITPDGYAEEILRREVVRCLWAGVETTISIYFDQLSPLLESLMAARRFAAAATIARRSYETSAKLEHLVRDVVEVEKRLRPQTLWEPENWPSLDTENIEARVDDVRRTAVLRLGDAAFNAYAPAFDQGLPDLFGQAYHVIAQEGFVAMYTGDAQFSSEIANRFVLLAAGSLERLRAQLQPSQFPAWAGQIALDLVELCGYSVILSGLDRSDYWSPYRTALDQILTQGDALCVRLDAYVRLARYSKESLMITPRSLLRFSWDGALRKKRESAGLRGRERFGYGTRRARPWHPNPLIRAMLSGADREDVAFDAFVAAYIVRRCGMLDCFADSAVRFITRLRREHHAGNRFRRTTQHSTSIPIFSRAQLDAPRALHNAAVDFDEADGDEEID